MSVLFSLLVSILIAPAVPARQNPAPGGAPLATRAYVQVARDGRGFSLGPSGPRFVPWGNNYGPQSGLLEDRWETDWPRVAADFREMRDLGTNVVRIHLQFGKFMEAPDRPNRKALARLDRLVKLAEQTGLYLDLTGLGCYRKADVPAWYDALDETARWNAQARFWEAVAARCAKSPAIFCYDLMNEPFVPGGRRKPRDWYSGQLLGGYDFVQFITLDQADRPREEIARLWVRRLIRAIHRHERRHMITVGMLPWTPKWGYLSGFNPEKLAPELDFISVHIYPEAGKVPEALTVLKRFAAGKPVVIEETFPLACSGADLEQFLLQSRGLASGWIGHYLGVTRTQLEERRRAKIMTIGEALMAAWFDLFTRLKPQMTEQNSALSEPHFGVRELAPAFAKGACSRRNSNCFRSTKAEINETAASCPAKSESKLSHSKVELPWYPHAPPLPPPTGEVIRIATVEELFAAAARVKPGGTLLLADGHYLLPRRLELHTDRITLRGASGRRGRVVLDGGGIGEAVALTACSDVTIADLTVQNVRWNGIKINSETGVQRLRIYHCLLHNIWQRAIKGVMVPLENREKLRPTGCRIQYCLFTNDRPKQFSDDPADTAENFNGNYIGGIDVMFARGWAISDNVFVGIHGRTGEARGAIFLWHDSRGCLIERNVIVDCDSGICLGNSRRPPEISVHCRSCFVRDNFVTRAHENGILADYTQDCRILHNTIHDPDSRLGRLIRLVHDNDGLLVANNLLSGPPLRDESTSRIQLRHNPARAMTAAFVDPAAGNLRLTARAAKQIERGERLPDVPEDIDRTPRRPRTAVGAHELPTAERERR